MHVMNEALELQARVRLVLFFEIQLGIGFHYHS
jgi:hypothetical protein